MMRLLPTTGAYPTKDRGNFYSLISVKNLCDIFITGSQGRIQDLGGGVASATRASPLYPPLPVVALLKYGNFSIFFIRDC